MLLNQDQDLLADLSIAICFRFLFFCTFPIADSCPIMILAQKHNDKGKENDMHTFGVKFSGPKIHWCANNDNYQVDNVFGTYVQYLCNAYIISVPI